MFTHALSDHCSSRDSLGTDKANRGGCGCSSLSGPHGTDPQCVRVQRRVDKALTSGCKAMIRFLSSLPIVVHAKQRQGTPQSGIMCTYLYYWRHFVSQTCVLKNKKRACKPPCRTTNGVCSSPDGVCNCAGSQSGHSLEEGMTKPCFPHQVDQGISCPCQ